VKTLRSRAAVLLAAVLLGACASLPSPEDGNGTLLVVAVKTEKAGDYALSYEFGLKESPQVLRVDPKDGIVTFRSIPPGSYTIDKVAVVPGPTIAGSTYLGDIRPRPLERPISFTLVAGSITILKAGILVGHETMENTTYQGWVWFEADREQVLARLAGHDNFDLWKVAP
jgi:hypothetical protein